MLGPKPLRAVSLEGDAAGKTLFQSMADGLWGGTANSGGDAKGTRKVGAGRVAWGMSVLAPVLSQTAFGEPPSTALGKVRPAGVVAPLYTQEGSDPSFADVLKSSGVTPGRNSPKAPSSAPASM